MTAAGNSKRTTPDPSRIQDLFLSRLDELEARVAEELARPAEAASPVQQFALDVGHELWMAVRSFGRAASEPGGLLRRFALLAAAAPNDELGVDGNLAETVREVVKPFARMWLGLAHSQGSPLPAEGGVLVLANRSAWPWPVEALVLWSILAEHSAGRRVHVLWDRRYLEGPFVGDAYSRIGFASADLDSCATLLERGCVVLAFPEGRAALAKTYEQRYRLVRFSDAHLIQAALDTDAAIVPAAVLGPEESYATLGALAGLPLTPQFPLLGLAGMLPLPLRWRFRLGATVEYARLQSGDTGGLADAVRGRIQAMLGGLLSSRVSIVRG